MSNYDSAGDYINAMYTPRAISDMLCRAAVGLSNIDAGEEDFFIKDMQQTVSLATELLDSFTIDELKKLGVQNFKD